MNSEFLSVVQNLQCQTTTNDFLPSGPLQDFLSTFSPTDSFQTPFFGGGVLDADSLDSRSPFSDYASEDSFVDVMSPAPCPAPDQEEVRRQRLARKAELARASRKRKQQINMSSNNFDEGDSDSSASGSRSPQSDYTDMSMSPGPQSTNWEDDEDVRRKRLARKAELARVSRKKKKDRIEELESQLTQMQNELRIARHMSVTPNPDSIVCKPEMENNNSIIYPEQPNAADRLNQAMRDFANPNYLGAFYTAFIDKIRQDMTQIDQLQASMQSSLCLRFVQWIMNQNDKFYEDSCGLWYSLFSQEVGASPTQLAQLLELRKEFAQKLSIPGPDMVAQAFDALRKAMDDSSRMMGAFAQIFSPAQLVLFFQWVERFGPVCIKINL